MGFPPLQTTFQQQKTNKLSIGRRRKKIKNFKHFKNKNNPSLKNTNTIATQIFFSSFLSTNISTNCNFVTNKNKPPPPKKKKKKKKNPPPQKKKKKKKKKK